MTTTQSPDSSLACKHVVIPLQTGDGFLQRARLALRFVEKHASQATLLLVPTGPLSRLERATRKLAVLLYSSGPVGKRAVVRTVGGRGVDRAVRALGRDDLLLVPEKGCSTVGPLSRLDCRLLVLDPS